MLPGNALDLDAKPPADRLHRLFDLRPFHEHSIAVCRTDVIQIDVDGKAGQIKKKQVQRSSSLENEAVLEEGVGVQ